MKHLPYLLTILLYLSLHTPLEAQTKRETRTFQQINDSILQEADKLYMYEQAFTQTVKWIDGDRRMRSRSGEVHVISRNDSIIALIMDAKSTQKVISEVYYYSSEDAGEINPVERPLAEEELHFIDMKALVMRNVQSKYSFTNPGKDEFFNPVFIPFTDVVRGKERHLYKLYLLTETTATSTIPFGRDYLYYADEEGKIFYNLQFNQYMPHSVTQEDIDQSQISITYPDREPFITPADIYHFRKYATRYEINRLLVHSTNYGIDFLYDWDRNELNVVMPEE
ncbi:MAG: hypothetical protein Q4F57_00710 [Weeksellaceae bacterium]|nr:hypothetical protein [Weeksellaceae bacterium]